MLNKLRGKFKALVLKEEYELLNTARENYVKATERVEIDPARAFRSQMKSFDPLTMDNMDDIEVMYDTEDDGIDSFLSDMTSLSNNKSLQEVIKVIKRNQVMFIALESQNIEQVNFGRASINGLMLLGDEIDRLAGIHAKRNEPEENYDKGSVV